jgi:hypothetical protein
VEIQIAFDGQREALKTHGGVTGISWFVGLIWFYLVFTVYLADLAIFAES